MPRPDLILLHPPSIFNFREHPVFSGPISDVIPSSVNFEIYPIGFITLASHLERHGITTRIVNLALKMMSTRRFDTERFIGRLETTAFGIDLHWLPHADGALCLARLLKKHHPRIPVIFGGFSATYYREEIMRDYPEVDFILCGDSTEEPLRLLMEAILEGRGYAAVPNLVWRHHDGRIVDNGITSRPTELDGIHFDYPLILRQAIRYRDPFGLLPFRGWLSYPVSAVFTCRGCTHNCGSCGGSLSGFRSVCARHAPVYRAPELVVHDVLTMADLTAAPIFVIGDLLQAGRDYGDRFLNALSRHRVKNEIAIEFFNPPPQDFLHRLGEVVENYNVEISPESHDVAIRQTFGKCYDNHALEGLIESLINNGCRRVDLFFMTGLPFQDYASVMGTVDYCGYLLNRYGSSGRLLPLISPLAPFVDPGSAIFESPAEHGYRIFYRTLAEHRQAMLMPSWQQTLNYETDWMSREEIVRATYDGARMLVGHKERHGLVSRERAQGLREIIDRAKRLVERIDREGTMNDDLRHEAKELNRLSSLCDKHELDWPLRGWRLAPLRMLRALGARRLR
jgi:B12-binding domain/radical SAM domain protein